MLVQGSETLEVCSNLSSTSVPPSLLSLQELLLLPVVLPTVFFCGEVGGGACKHICIDLFIYVTTDVL